MGPNGCSYRKRRPISIYKRWDVYGFIGSQKTYLIAVLFERELKTLANTHGIVGLSLQQHVSFSGLPTCWGEVLVLIYQAGFEVYSFLQGILPLLLFILCLSGVSASLFMHPIPRNSFLIHLHPHHSWKHNHLLSPGRGAAWPKWNEIFLTTQLTTSSSDWEVTALPG